MIHPVEMRSGAIRTLRNYRERRILFIDNPSLADALDF
jgi:hypothetical protein